jgi:hypothetical protein
MGVFDEGEHVALVPPIESAANLDHHDAIVNALTYRRSMLDVALSQFTIQARELTKVASLLLETLRTGVTFCIALIFIDEECRNFLSCGLVLFSEGSR